MDCVPAILESIELPRQTAWCMCSASQRGKHSTDPVNVPPAQLSLAANSRTYDYSVTQIILVHQKFEQIVKNYEIPLEIHWNQTFSNQ